jgi:hypothetical protein
VTFVRTLLDHDRAVFSVDVHIAKRKELALSEPAQSREHDQPLLSALRRELLHLAPVQEARSALLRTRR